jgi:tRNA-2-methylthio-N6-dimethylallyladenosine synthase
MESIEKVIDERLQGKALVTHFREGNTKKLFIESYGCQMNMNDSEIVASILADQGFNTTQILEEADLVYMLHSRKSRDNRSQSFKKIQCC